MKFIRTFENFTEMDMGHQNMEDVCSDCQCNTTECECGSQMAYEDDMEDEYGENFHRIFPHEEGGEEEFDDENYVEGSGDLDYQWRKLLEDPEFVKKLAEKQKESEGQHVNKFDTFSNEAKKAKPDFLDLDKDGDKKESMKKAAADKKKGGKKEDKKEDKKEEKESPKKGGLSKAQEKLPEGLRKAIAAKRKK